MKEIVVVDFSGTLIKPFVAEEANLKRYSLLGIPEPSKKKQLKGHGDKSHYETIKKYISTHFGLTDDMEITAVQNYGRDVALSGKDVQTNIMTDLFRNCMYGVANKYKQKIFTEGIITVLQTIQKKGYKLAIVSGVRTDIITGMLAITQCPLRFDYIYGQDPVLSKDDNEQRDQELAKEGNIIFIIGDKLDDLQPAKKLTAKSIFLRGGHPTGGEEEFADYSIDHPRELMNIIQ